MHPVDNDLERFLKKENHEHINQPTNSPKLGVVQINRIKDRLKREHISIKYKTFIFKNKQNIMSVDNSFERSS